MLRRAVSDSDDAHARTFVSAESKMPVAAALEPGDKLGRYVVLEVLGAGGMGLVFAAFDPVLDRQVAIKVLRVADRGSFGSSGGTSRLLREAQAMARLSHPNVVPVYDVGSVDGSVFVAMELVRGLALDKWLVEKPRPWREQLELFLAAGRGLQAAHEAGLVHRDFKPANVLVGADGRPRVTDFGLAHSTRAHTPESTPKEHAVALPGLAEALTQAGSIMGTPGYMAPEQYTGAPTSPATDQYAFCASLYEALYGARPFPGTDLPTLARLTQEGQVPPPPQGSRVPPWLFPIIARGLSPDPAARHPSLAALLDALARDPRRVRNQRLAAAATLLVALGGLGTWSWLSERSVQECRASAQKLSAAWDDGVKAKAERAFSASGASWAKLTWARTRDSMDEYARAWAQERVEACEATRVRREQSERQLSLRLSCLDRRLDELSTLAQAFSAAGPELVGQAGTTVTRLTPVSACRNLEALEELQRLAPAARERVDRMEQQVAQGRMLVAAARLSSAREKIEPAVAEATALGVPAFEAETFEALGELERESGHYPQARAAFDRSVRAAFAAGDERRAARVLAAQVSLVGWRLERPSDGLMLEPVVRGVIARLGADRQLAALLDEGLGDAQWQAGDRPAALESYQRALLATLALQGPDSADVARLHSSVGWVLMELGRTRDARSHYEQSREIRERLLGADHPSLTYTWNELGHLAEERGEPDEAVRCFERSRAIGQQAFLTDSSSILRQTVNLAGALARAERFSEAAPLLDIAEKVFDQPQSEPFIAARVEFQATRAQVLLGQQRASEAVQSARVAQQLGTSAFGAEHPQTLVALPVLAAALEATGKPAEAVATLDEYLAASTKKGACETADCAAAWVHGGRALLALRRKPEALARLEKGLALLGTVEGNERLKAESRLALADALWATGGDRTRARALAEKARAGFESLRRSGDVQAAEAWLAAHRR